MTQDAVDPSLITAVEASIERICDMGCRVVWQNIAALERDECPPEVQGLSGTERAMVLSELKTIMAVYGDRYCSFGR